MAAFATSADLALAYDVNSLKDLASDTGTPVTDLSTSSVITFALEYGSGRVLAACRLAQAYSEADLAALTGNSLALLKGIVCVFAMAMLLRRRPEKFVGDSIARAEEQAEEYLDALQGGKRVFDSAAQVAAGLPTIDGPSVVKYEELNLLPDRTSHFFPSRGSRLPQGRD